MKLRAITEESAIGQFIVLARKKEERRRAGASELVWKEETRRYTGEDGP